MAGNASKPGMLSSRHRSLKVNGSVNFTRERAAKSPGLGWFLLCDGLLGLDQPRHIAASYFDANFF